MADTSNLSKFLGDVAEAIRTKRETTDKIPAEQFDSEILKIETGTDTSDATVTVNDVIAPKTFYANNQKLTGVITPTYGLEEETNPTIEVDMFVNDTSYTVLYYNHDSRLALVNADGVVRIYEITNPTLSKNEYVTSYSLSEDSSRVASYIGNTDGSYDYYVVVTQYGANTGITDNGFKVRIINKADGTVVKTASATCSNFSNRNRYSNVRVAAFDPKHLIFGFSYLASNGGAGYTYGMYTDLYRYDYTTNTCVSINRTTTLLYNSGNNTSSPTGTCRMWFTPNYKYINCATWNGQSSTSCCLILQINDNGSITQLLKYQNYSGTANLRCIDWNGKYYDGSKQIDGPVTPINLIAIGRNSVVGNYLIQQDGSLLRVYKIENNEYVLYQTITGTRYGDTVVTDEHGVIYYTDNANKMSRYNTLGVTELELLSLQRFDSLFVSTKKATGTAEDVEEGKVLFGKEGKIIGTLPSSTSQYLIDQTSYSMSGEKDVHLYDIDMVGVAPEKRIINNGQNVGVHLNEYAISVFATLVGLTPEKLVKGETVLNVTGTATFGNKVNGVVSFENREDLLADTSETTNTIGLVQTLIPTDWEFKQNTGINTFLIPKNITLEAAPTEGKYYPIYYVNDTGDGPGMGPMTSINIHHPSTTDGVHYYIQEGDSMMGNIKSWVSEDGINYVSETDTDDIVQSDNYTWYIGGDSTEFTEEDISILTSIIHELGYGVPEIYLWNGTEWEQCGSLTGTITPEEYNTAVETSVEILG